MEQKNTVTIEVTSEQARIIEAFLLKAHADLWDQKRNTFKTVPIHALADDLSEAFNPVIGLVGGALNAVRAAMKKPPVKG